MKEVENNNPLVRIKDLIPDIKIELKYSTEDNFTNKILYNFKECYLHKDIVEELCKVEEDLKKHNLGLKIWDGYRPPYAQRYMWEVVQDSRYVGEKTGRHSRGTAVDLTLVQLDTGEELEMPTPFDDFTPKADSAYMGEGDGVSMPLAIFNRHVLKEAMEARGLIQLDTEWWHFDLINWQLYPILHINLS